MDTQQGFPIGGTGLLHLWKVGRLIASWYWSGTEYATNTDNAWNFNMNNGNQNNNHQNNSGYGLALRSG
jgi:hypothetical protein